MSIGSADDPRVPTALYLWGTKWGTVPHGVQPISAKFDLAKTA
jgi:hypothetical protein